jgi:hypothetical protein
MSWLKLRSNSPFLYLSFLFRSSIDWVILFHMDEAFRLANLLIEMPMSPAHMLMDDTE